MLTKLIRKYNQNRKSIWTILAFIAFFVILLQVVFGIMRNSRENEQEKLLNYYNQLQNNNIVNSNLQGTNPYNPGNINNTSGSWQDVPDKITANSTANQTISYFGKMCNENKIDEAYNLISTDCKNVLFPTINDFKNNYYNKIFKTSQNVKIENSMYNNGIYKVIYSNNNILANGGYTSSIQDYIYVTDENGEKRVSLNGFLYTKEINNKSTKDNVEIKVLKKKVYIDNEKYQIQIINNTNEKIYIPQESKKVYLIDKNDMEYTSDIDQLQVGITLIEKGKSIIIELTFNKNFRNAK